MNALLRLLNMWRLDRVFLVTFVMCLFTVLEAHSGLSHEVNSIYGGYYSSRKGFSSYPYPSPGKILEEVCRRDLDNVRNETMDGVYGSIDASRQGSREFSGDEIHEKVVVFEKRINLPQDSSSLTLDIVHNFDMYVEFHEGDIESDQLNLRLDAENMGDNSVLHDFTLDFRIISLGTETELILYLNHPSGPDNINYNHELTTSTTVIVIVIIISTIVIYHRNSVFMTMSKKVKQNHCKDKTCSEYLWSILIRCNVRMGQPSNVSASWEQHLKSGAHSIHLHRSEHLGQGHASPQCQGLMPDSHQTTSGNTEHIRPSADTAAKDLNTDHIRPSTDIADINLNAQEAWHQSTYHHQIQHGASQGQETQTKKAEVQTWRDCTCSSPSMTHVSRDQEYKMEEPEKASPSSKCQCERHDQKSRAHAQYSHNSIYLNQSASDVDGRPSISHAHKTRSQPVRARFPLRGVACALFATLVIVAMAVGVSRLTAKPTLHVTFPASNTDRKVRMFSDFPDLRQLSKNHSSLSLLSRLQLLDTQRCKHDLTTCKINVVCDSSTDQSINCRCRHGYYFKDWQCQECSTQCPADHFLASTCGLSSDAVCKPCTVCGKTQYEAAPCNTHRDTICVDVSFPVGILPMNRSHLPDDGIEITVSHSPNVFLERLVDMEALETPMYVTNNQQSLDFVWPRLSGLDIAVSVSGVYLVPDYQDLDAEDDTALFQRLLEPTQTSKDYYTHVQDHYCRHPIPDYYSLQLVVEPNRTSAARVIRCDSQDESVPRCPDHFKDGDRYLRWDINKPCPNMPGGKLDPINDGPNSVVCTDETDILRQVFYSARPTTEEYMFPTRECQRYRQQCEQCLKSAKCPAGSPSNNQSYLGEDNQCCGIPCYTKTPCQKAYSPDCPMPTVECAKGDVNIFSLFPHFESMEKQFACHLKYKPPEHLYSISYTIRAPSINFNMTPQHFTVTPNSRLDHQKRLSRFDFINAIHDTRLKVEDELVLIGDHLELAYYSDSLMKPYTVRDLKTPEELGRKQMFPQDYMSKSAYLQFERPFLYSSWSWYRDGCHKNLSQIYPNQTIYKEDFIPVMARKNLLGQSLNQHPGYSYQLYHRDRAPFVKFYVEKGTSVLQHLQGTIVTGKLVPNSLYGRVTWHHDTATWKLVFSGLQDECPTIITLKIFTQLMTGCAGHFDLLINCPEEFTVTFNMSTGTSDLPDIFILQVNDSATSHNMVLSSVYSPIYVDEVTSKTSSELRQKFSSEDEKQNIVNIWIPIIVIVFFSFLVLTFIYICYKCINSSRVRRVERTEGEAVALNNQGEKFNTVTASGAKPQPRCSICVFILLYLVYCLVFTFSLTFGIIYIAQASIWTNLTRSDYLGTELHLEVNKSLQEIQKFEKSERLRLFESYEERREACIHHLELENQKLLLDYEKTTQRQVEAIFQENGTLHHFTNEIQKQNVSAYMKQIQDFVSECNKTINSIVERFQANYFQFLRNTAHNDWLKVPRQIFLFQDGENVDRQFLSSTHVKQFASWLEIDKTEELLATSENVFGRLSSVPQPKVSTLDSTFPSLRPQANIGLPVFQSSSHSFIYTVQDPLFTEEDMLDNSTTTTPHMTTRSRWKRDLDAFGLSGNLKHNPDSSDFSDVADKQDGKVGDAEGLSDPIEGGSSFESDAGYKTDNSAERSINGGVSKEDFTDVDDVPVDMNVVSIEEAEVDMKRNYSPRAEPLRSSDEPSSENSEKNSESSSAWLYILIATFVILDIVLLAYRFSWLSNQVYAARHGYADRIPTDEACKQVLEIQTAYHLPAFENPHDESSGYYVDGKEQLYGSEKETDITFLQSFPKSKDDILQKIWNEKMNKSDDRTIVRMQKCFLVRWYDDLRIILHRLCLSNLVWQGSVTFLAIIFICVFVYCMEFWLTADNFRTLVGGQSAAADVQWHLDMSDRYLHGLAQQLTVELQRLKGLCDREVDVLTDMFFTTVNMQTSMFTDTLQRLCREAKGRHCDKLMAHQSTGGRIVGCNFLPLQAQTFHDLSLLHMEAVVAKEVTPLMNLSHRMLSISASIIVFLLCCRLICQAGATTMRHYLLLTGRLPRVRVYQSEETHANGGPNSTTMQRSQSWVDSCESGVYLGEADDTNKEEGR